MPKHLLTVKKIEALKATGRPYRVADGENLYVLVGPTGVKSWQFRYRHNGKQQTASLGKLNSVPLADARKKAQEARERAGRDEHLTRAKHFAKARKAAAAGNTFEKVAADWVKVRARRMKWTAAYQEDVTAALKNHLSALHPLQISDVSAPITSPILAALEKRFPDTAGKMRQRLHSIMDYAVESGLIVINPLPRPQGGLTGEKSKRPAVLTRDGVGAILRAADKVECSKGVRRAHLLCTFTAQRISEVVGARWSEFDLEEGTWFIPRERMKRKDAERQAHEIPIPSRLLTLICEWKRADGDTAEWVCKAPRGDGSITIEALEKLYRETLKLSGKHSPHSWRSVFSTWSADAGKAKDLREKQLDHIIGSETEEAYDRATRLELRRGLMQWHEDSLIAARDGADVIPLRKSGG